MKLGAVGDAVNVAARVQGLTGQCGCSVLITRDTYELVKDEVCATCCGTFEVKGREQPVEVFGVDRLRVDEDEQSQAGRLES